MIVRVRGAALWLWCPACEDTHRITVGQSDSWTWDGNEAAPTISPSILVQGVQWDESSDFHKPRHHIATGEQTICHSLVRSGVWEFLGDCTHDLAGQKVSLVPLPDWFNDATGGSE